ncbi:MAG: hypothetical protein EOP45_04585, partial [Sphingobacteriaceae bacterium]
MIKKQLMKKVASGRYKLPNLVDLKKVVEHYIEEEVLLVFEDIGEEKYIIKNEIAGVNTEVTQKDTSSKVAKIGGMQAKTNQQMEVLCSDLKNLQINHVQNPLQIPHSRVYNFQMPVSNALQNQIHQQVPPNQRNNNHQRPQYNNNNQQNNNFQPHRVSNNNQHGVNKFNNNNQKSYINNSNPTNTQIPAINNQNFMAQQPSMPFCSYCNTEGHSIGRCRWVIQDKQAGLLQDRMDGFFLPNSNNRMYKGANEGIRQQVIKYSEDQANLIARNNIQQQQNTPIQPAPVTPTHVANTVVIPPVTPTAILTKDAGKERVQELKSNCGILEDWSVPEFVNKQGEIKAAAGTKLYGVEMKTRSGRAVEPEASTSKHKKKKQVSIDEVVQEIDAMDVDDYGLGEDERGILEDSLKRIKANNDSDRSENGSAHTRRPTYIIPNDGDFVKDRTEKGLPAFANKTKVVSEVVEKIMKGAIELQIKELCAISPVISEEVKKWVSKRRLNLNQTPMASLVNKNPVESDFDYETDSASSLEVNIPQSTLYSTPLGHVEITVGKMKLKALIDSGSQINIIPLKIMQRLPVQTMVNLKSGVRGISGHRTPLCGIAENVRIDIGANIGGMVHFFVAEDNDTPILLGRPFLFDFEAQLSFEEDIGERLSIKDTRGVWMKIRLCEPDRGTWERKLNVNVEERQGFIIKEEFTNEVVKELHEELNEEEIYGLKFEDDIHMEQILINEINIMMNIEDEGILYSKEEVKEYRSFGTKYKSVEKKVKPVNAPMPQYLNFPLQRPTLSRDPYDTPLIKNPPEFIETNRTTTERLKQCNFGPEGWLSDEEWKLFLHILVLREGAVAYCEEERGLFKHTYGLPYVIPIIKHEPWQIRPIPIPAAIRNEYIELIRQRIRTGLYEQSSSSYSSPVFCVLKGDGKLRIVHDLQVLNKVTIKDAGIPPSPEDFVESFAGRACYGLGDIMGGYDERELAQVSRALTTFDTPLGRLQLTRLPQGATNSVAVYQAQMTWVLQEELPQNVGIFIDDGGIKGPEDNYNNEVLKENNGIRKFIWEYAIVLERILFRIEEAGLTVSGKKFAVCVPALEIVGHIVSEKGRSVSIKKKNKIQSWPRPTNKTQVLGFLGTCIYVRMFIPNFGHLAAPLRRLTRLKVDWDWTEECEEAFILLKKIVGEEIVLAALDYSKEASTIILAVDSSYIAAGGVLMQENEEGEVRPVFYESEVFSEVESRYSQPKLELCGVAKILRKFKTKLWGQHFELQVDAKALIQMINAPSLPNAAMTRWVAYIQLFSFDLIHKHGKSFGMPDGLSRRVRGSESDEAESFNEEKKDIGVYESLYICIGGLQSEEEEEILVEESMWDQEGIWKNLKEYLTTMRRPEECEDKEFQKIKSKVPLFYVENDRLKKRGVPQGRLVISKLEGQKFILKKLHEELGHRGVEETYRRCLIRFWWPEMKECVRRWVVTCEICQKKGGKKEKEVGRATGENTIFGRVSLDAVHI